jgi:hypothetical protein
LKNLLALLQNFDPCLPPREPPPLIYGYKEPKRLELRGPELLLEIICLLAIPEKILPGGDPPA